MPDDTFITLASQPLDMVPKALILLHARGGRAVSILSLACYLPLVEYALLAPQAPGQA